MLYCIIEFIRKKADSVMQEKALGQASRSKAGRSDLFKRIRKNKEIYLILSVGIVWYVVFCYLPMGGLSLAFKTYKANKGVWGSPWCGLDNFKFVFQNAQFWAAFWNTIRISLERLLIEFPIPILLALFLNEISHSGYKRVLQTILTFPNFLSWIVVSSVMLNLLGNNGYINTILTSLGGNGVNFLGSPSLFRPVLYLTSIWKSAGWSAIIYMAAISGVGTEQYEAATIDGARKWQKAVYITLPSIKPTIVVMFILAVGGIMNAGFDQIFMLYSALVYDVADIIDTYVYRIGIQKADYSFSTAAGMFKSVIALVMILIVNFVAKKTGNEGIW